MSDDLETTYHVTRDDSNVKIYKLKCAIEGGKPCIGYQCPLYIGRPLHNKEATGQCRFYDQDAVILIHK